MDAPDYLAEGTPAAKLAEAISAAGHRLYLVGGPVRDAILKRPVRELDFTTDARPDSVEDIARKLGGSVWLQGVRFGTVGIELGGRLLEVTTFRTEVYHPDSRKPGVVFGDSLEVDLSRRDFTVNAMALSLPSMELVDPYGGLHDLLTSTLKTPLAPEVAFSDDPLRMLRACRFVSTHGFEADP